MINFVFRYEGTGRSLSLKLIQQLRKESSPIGSLTTKSPNKGGSSTSIGRTLQEISLSESIRYAPGDEVERWLNALLCLDATVIQRGMLGCPLPEYCELYPLLLRSFFPSGWKYPISVFSHGQIL